MKLRETYDFVLVKPVPDFEEEAGEILFGNGGAVYANALAHSDQMRRSVESWIAISDECDKRVMARRTDFPLRLDMAQDRVRERTGRPLALRASDMNHVQGIQVLRLAAR